MNTRRRWLAAGAAWPALAWTGALRAQAKPPLVIGYLQVASRDTTGQRNVDVFNAAMAALGWKLGTTYVLEVRYAEGRAERLPALAQEIAAKSPAVIVAHPSLAASAAAAAAPTTPVVLGNGDPLAQGLVTSLARPGGMITGLSNVSSESTLKVFELLVEALPKLKRVGVLADSTTRGRDTNVSNARSAAERFRFEAVVVDMARPEDIEPAIARLAQANVQALVVMPSVWFSSYLAAIVGLALAQRWPVAGNLVGVPRQGGLFSFGANTGAMITRTAYYVDRILKGAKPGDLPIEQPTTFDLVLNLKTAKQLGITIPSSMRLRATEVIE
jgi:putative tryptophan/tyrosine transport system substrate-binding protein